MNFEEQLKLMNEQHAHELRLSRRKVWNDTFVFALRTQNGTVEIANTAAAYALKKFDDKFYHE
jgi:hypothetical protein